ncbi:MAG: YkgJ family cysteine cluster protein [Acidobacteriota bacterium]
MDCRPGCAACCIIPSISTPIPGMPAGKPAYTRCVQLSPDNRCLLFGQPERPSVCLSFAPQQHWCGESNEEAFLRLESLERLTRP